MAGILPETPDKLHAPEAERRLVDAVLYLADLPPGTEKVAPEDFEDARLGRIWRAILEDFAADGRFNTTTILALLADKGAVDKETARIVRDADGNAIMPSDAPAYAEIVTDRAARRRLDAIGEELRRAARSGQPTAELAARLASVAKRGLGTAFRSGSFDAPRWLEDEWFTLAERSAFLSGEEPARRRWLLWRQPKRPENDGGGLLVSGRVGLLAAPGGAGKSMALAQLALSVATGKPWFGEFGVAPEFVGRRVLLAMGEEDAEEIHRRLFYAAKGMGLTDSERRTAEAAILPLPLMGKEAALTTGATGGASAGPTPLVAQFLAKLEASGPWALLVFDPLSRFAGPDAETDNAAATRLIEAFERFTEAPGNPAVLVAHHTRKARNDGTGDGADAARGASALVDGVRWVGSLIPEEAGGPVKFKVVKSNYAPPPEALTLLRDEGGFLRSESAPKFGLRRQTA